jgi:tetratricopeptide (TPR) repeat protein
MVTGRAPFRGDYEQAVMYSILNEEPELVTSVREGAPAELEDIIAKALAKKPEARYQSAAEFLSALTALSQKLAVAPEGKTGKRVSKTARGRALRKQLRVGLPAAAVIVAGAVVLMQVRSARDASHSKNLAVAVIEFRDSVNPDDPTVSSGITGLVQVGLTETSPIRVISPELLSDIRRRLFGAQSGPIAPDQILEVARKAGSTMYVAGEIVGTAAEQYVTWRLVDTRSGKSLGARRVTGTTMMELADGIIHGVLPLLPRPAEARVPESVSSVSEIVTSSKEAYEHYVKAKLIVDDWEKVTAGGRDEAIAELQEAVAIDSTFALAYAQLAVQLSQLPGTAETQDLKYLTEKAWTYRDRLGLLHRMMLEGYREELEGNVPAAMVTYREILARWPDNKTALSWLCGTAFWYWYFEEALTLSAQGLALYPDEQGFLSIKRSALRELGRGEEALQQWIATAREHPTPWVWSELGENYLAQGFPDSAEAYYRRASFERPGERERVIADCFYARGDVEHAIQMREALMKKSAGKREHRRTLLDGKATGLVYYMAEIGRFNRSIELLHEYESVVSESKGAIPGEVYLLTRMGQVAKAVDLARTRLKSTTTAADSLDFNLELIEALAAAGSVKEARRLLRELLELDETRLWGTRKYRALLLRSIVALAEGDPEGALKAIHETEKMAKPSVFLRFGVAYREALARAYWRSGRLGEAVDAYKALLKVFGGHAISHYELGQVYEQMKRPADAKREYSTFLEMCSLADKGWRPVEDARKRLAAL